MEIEVHPWFCVTYRDKKFRDIFPGVELVDNNGDIKPFAVDVHRQNYRDFIVKLIVDIVKSHDVDGILLDYIRTMGRCYCKKCGDEFFKMYGKPLWEATENEWVAWQKEAISDIVRRTSEGVKSSKLINPIISAAVTSKITTRRKQGQAPKEWLKKKYIDVVIPMQHMINTSKLKKNITSFQELILNDKLNDKSILTGLSLYYRIGGKEIPRPASLVEDQISLIRELRSSGYCLFAYCHLNDSIIDMLNKINKENAVPWFRRNGSRNYNRTR